MTKYTTMHMPLTMYNTTKSPVVFCGPSPAHPLKVRSETAPETKNIPIELSRRSQTDNVVPSSYSWNPTKPLIRRQVHKADIKPFWAETKYGYTEVPGGMTPESRMREKTVKAM
jgi:hypothetical protein